MLNLSDVTAIINEHAETIGAEVMAAIGEKLLESDVAVDTTELDNVRAELEAKAAELETERAGREADKQSYLDRINKFIYGGDPGPGPEPEVKEELEVEEAVEIEDPYEELYGGNE